MEGDRVMPWVLSSRFPPPRDRTILVRFGGSIFDAGYFPWHRKWFWLMPGGSQQEIPDPPMWFCHEPVVTEEEERAALATLRAIPAGLRPRKGQQTLALDFSPGDSGKLSSTRTETQKR